jgi:putative resolvase
MSMARKKAEGPQAPKMLRVHMAAYELGLHPFTVRRWIKQGKIQAVKIGLEARIPRSEIERLIGKIDERIIVLYARVSGDGQQDDLAVQIARLQLWVEAERPGQKAVVLSDIGSGLKANRKHLQYLLKMVCEDRVAEIVITYSDRLTRFGQEYLEILFESFGVSLTILDPDEQKSPEQELTDDLLAILASFSGRLYGRRSHKQKELVTCAQAVINNP